MHIVSWNVNGLPTTLKEASYHHGSIENYFAEVLKADIVCFQVQHPNIQLAADYVASRARLVASSATQLARHIGRCQTGCLSASVANMFLAIVGMHLD